MRLLLKFVLLLIWLAVASCAPGLPEHPRADSLRAYVAKNDTWHFSRHAPVFVVEEPGRSFNRIGTAAARMTQGAEEVYIDSEQPTLYARKTSFRTARGSYTNLTYRVHFEKVPATRLGWGKNVGLLVIVTLNESGQPVLFTTLHTCGCYLAFTPTSYLDEAAYPPGWERGRQKVYGESLPGYIDYGEGSPTHHRLHLLLRKNTHRVMDLWLADSRVPSGYQSVLAPVKPLKVLEGLGLPDGASTSFYETEGGRRDYVKDSQKPWERLFMSWWAFDWRVGEDKKLGRDREDGIVFYTSLKPWAREASDLRNFPVFLQYWGWNL